MIRLPVHDPSAISQARHAASRLAERRGLSATDVARLALVVTEAGTNLLKHGGGGELLIAAADGDTAAVQVLALDKGRGMANLQECLRDGYSTAGSPGTGLGAMQRLSDLFDIHSEPGRGTAVLARVGPASASAGPLVCGVVRLPHPGEDSCGDNWAERREAAGALLLVVDGLGHGPLAEAASDEAVRIFLTTPGSEPARLLERIHEALRPTRGAAAAIAHVDTDAGRVSYAGVGNIAGVVLSGAERRSMVSMAGIVGHQARRIQQFEYEWHPGALLVMNSDGLTTSWDLAGYRGLMQRHPMLIAGVLYRDFSRQRDDVAVAVLKGRTA